MPGKYLEGLEGQDCRRCKEKKADLVVRREPLCQECFIKYVNTKAIKKMESFRVRHSAPDQQRKILLPLSLGVSSLSLLHILDRQLRSQTHKSGRTGFALVVVYVDESQINESGPSRDLLAQVRGRYPDHEYATVLLQDLFRLIPADDPLLRLLPDQNLENERTPLDHLVALMNSLSWPTARADIIPILRTRLLVEQAKQSACEAVVWGDTTTRLAEKTFSETAKGRGFSLPWQISDGESPFGITFNYPMRDLLKKELFAYADFLDPPLSPLIHDAGPSPSSMNSKTTTIDDVMKQYFESAENFPNYIANVVTTTSKLEAKAISPTDPRCALCSMPVADGRFGNHGWGGYQQDGSANSSSSNTPGLCYGCTRTVSVKSQQS
ncbi:uncharacterized protein EI97DRAFT_373078 [Westerdykella ornata]|uniref:Cytoplasmic tRNA 2-thiolation protein 2 n=1 Tax=Westerdykella ornata TaxID=318751 RepID=A0A6A6JNQ1_WESOR|nr:uncharacterized protein EI97DRAFT_373078 [Westerdykella ornata]KAF2278251.1 hypothetical protein EI97DRAFT_373078 [Westerdykella ornata]